MFAAFGEKAVEDRMDNSDAEAVVTELSLFPRIAKVAPHLKSLKTILVVGDPKKIKK